jgi:ubiquinone/menaquinone biosynthesis C-methylase UbiE
MVREAYTLARTLGHHNTAFCQADAEALPFRNEVCDLLTCKLAFHYFPHPQVALAEIARVATRAAHLMLIDRVSPEDPEPRDRVSRLHSAVSSACGGRDGAMPAPPSFTGSNQGV